MADGEGMSPAQNRLFRRSMSQARNSYLDRSSAILTIKRGSDGNLSMAEEVQVKLGAAEGIPEVADIQAPLLGSAQGDPETASDVDEGYDGRLQFAMNASLVANVVLLIAKAYAFYWSRSKAVLASTADSFVDIASQASCLNLNPDPGLQATASLEIFAPS